MADELKNTVDNEEVLIKETNPATEQIEEKPKKAEWEIQLENMLRNAYLKGVSTGGKTFVGVILNIIIDGKKNRLNTAKILMRIENTCKRMLAVSDSYNQTKSENTVESISESAEESEEIKKESGELNE